AADAKAMECTTGVRTAPMGAGWKWAPLADSASSHHIPSLAPAVALPAPRHDRRRTGAAGSPPGGFPFVELTWRGCEMGGGARGVGSRLSFYRCRTKLRSFPRKRESRAHKRVHARLRRAMGWVPATGSPRRERRGVPLAGTSGGENLATHVHRALLDSGNPLCYRTQPLRGPAGGISGA